MKYLIFLPIVFGICSGAFLGYWSSRPLVSKLGSDTGYPRLVLWCSATGALLIALPAFFVAFIIGGDLSGALLEASSAIPSIGPFITPFGLAAGITIVLGGGLATGMITGALFGKFAAYALRKLAPGKSFSG
jgi:hypothetical protein